VTAIRPLSRTYVARGGAPNIERVELAIFQLRYFTHCLDCTTCHDWCCSHGVDVDVENKARILAQADAIERSTGVPRDRFFTPGVHADAEFPGGASTRTQIENGACVFLDREKRGCKLHRYALEVGIDYHDVKPMVSALFPVTFDDGTLHASDEATDDELVCLGPGPTLYRGARSELLFYFGEPFVTELDAIERELDPTQERRLPVVS
jgi:Fe-S-cluster containining protein